MTLQRLIKCRMITAELRKHLILWANRTTGKFLGNEMNFVSLKISTAESFVPHAKALHILLYFIFFAYNKYRSGLRDYTERMLMQFIFSIC